VPLGGRFKKVNPKLSIELNFEDRYVDLVEQGIEVVVRMGAWLIPLWVRGSLRSNNL
jgi:DNA-binding transcriptional LysR family regulator